MVVVAGGKKEPLAFGMEHGGQLRGRHISSAAMCLFIVFFYCWTVWSGLRILIFCFNWDSVEVHKPPSSLRGILEGRGLGNALLRRGVAGLVGTFWLFELLYEIRGGGGGGGV